jgi:hypothetical protein
VSQQTYQLEIRWTHRKWGPQHSKMKQTANSVRRAINSGLQAFFTEQKDTHRQRGGRREYLDAHKHVRVEAWRL